MRSIEFPALGHQCTAVFVAGEHALMYHPGCDFSANISLFPLTDRGELNKPPPRFSATDTRTQHATRTMDPAMVLLAAALIAMITPSAATAGRPRPRRRPPPCW